MKTIIAFVSGLVIGGCAGYFIRKKFVEKKEIEAENEQLSNDGFDRITKEAGYVSDQNEEDIVVPVGGRMSDEERKELKEQIKNNQKKTTDYAAMYKHGDTETKNQTEEEDVDEEIPKEEDTIEETAFEEHQRTKHKQPKIISAEAYANLDARFDKEVLYYYTFDDVLAEENGEAVEDPGLLIGDSLTKYGFADSDEEQLIFVMNYATDTCYEIQKIDAMWSASH